MASLSQGRTAVAQCGLFTYKSVPVIFEPPYIYKLNYLRRKISYDNRLHLFRVLWCSDYQDGFHWICPVDIKFQLQWPYGSLITAADRWGLAVELLMVHCSRVFGGWMSRVRWGKRQNGGGPDTSTPDSPPLHTIPVSPSSSVPHPLIIYTPFSPCSCTPKFPF